MVLTRALVCFFGKKTASASLPPPPFLFPQSRWRRKDCKDRVRGGGATRRLHGCARWRNTHACSQTRVGWGWGAVFSACCADGIIKTKTFYTGVRVRSGAQLFIFCLLTFKGSHRLSTARPPGEETPDNYLSRRPESQPSPQQLAAHEEPSLSERNGLHRPLLFLLSFWPSSRPRPPSERPNTWRRRLRFGDVREMYYLREGRGALWSGVGRQYVCTVYDFYRRNAPH